MKLSDVSSNEQLYKHIEGLVNDLLGIEMDAAIDDEVKKAYNDVLAVGEFMATKAIEKLKQNINAWKSLDEEKPICFESGEWDGLKSEPFLCKTKGTENVFVAVAYEGFIDGCGRFFDIYNNSDALIISDDLEWRSLIV